VLPVADDLTLQDQSRGILIVLLWVPADGEMAVNSAAESA
jgi:hypothetical protein